MIIAEGTTFSQRDQQKNEFGNVETLSENSNLTLMSHRYLKRDFFFSCTHRLETLSEKLFHIDSRLEKDQLIPLKAVLSN